MFGILDLYYLTYFSMPTNLTINKYWNVSKTKNSVYKTLKSKRLICFPKNLKIFLLICFIIIQNQEWSSNKFLQINIFQNNSLYCLGKDIKTVLQDYQWKFLQEVDPLWVQLYFQSKKDKKEARFYQSIKWLKVQWIIWTQLQVSFNKTCVLKVWTKSKLMKTAEIKQV